MITQMRRLIQGTGFKNIVWFIVILFLIAGILPLLRFGDGGKTWIAQINGKTVGIKDYAYYVEQIDQQIRNIRSSNPGYAELILQLYGLTEGPEKIALKQITQQTLLSQTANKMNIHVHSDMIANAIPPIDPKVLEQYLKMSHLSMNDFVRILENDLKGTIVRAIVGASSYVPEFELKQQYQSEYLGKSFSILTLSFDSFLKELQQKPIDEKMLQHFYEKHKANYWVPEGRSGIVWTFEPQDYGFTISEEAIQDYYDKYKGIKYTNQPVQIRVRRILIKTEDKSPNSPAYQKIKEAHEKLMQDPSVFEILAKEVSDDVDTSKEGGLMPFFSRGQKERVFEKTAFLLKNDGDISNIITTNEGFEILQRVERKGKTYKSLQEVKVEIKQLLQRQEFNKQFGADIRQIVKQRKADGAALNEFIHDKKGKEETIGLSAKTNDKTIERLFNLKKGEVSSYVDGKGIIVKLTQIAEKYLPPLDDIKQKVTEDFQIEEATKALSKALEQMQKNKQKSFEELKNMFNATLEKTSILKKDNTESIQKWQQKGLPIDNMFQMESVGSVISSDTDQKAFLIKLDEVEAFNKDDYEGKKEEIAARLEREMKGVIIQGFVASLYRNAKIKVNKAIVNTQR